MHEALAKLSGHFHMWAIFEGLQDYIRFEPQLGRDLRLASSPDLILASLGRSLWSALLYPPMQP